METRRVCRGAARWKRQFQYLACEFLSVCKRVIDVAACLDSLAVGHLQALFFVGLRESLVGLAALCRQKQVNGFSKFPCDIVLYLGVRTAWLADRPLRRLCPIIEADQMYHCVAAVDEVTERLREWAMGEFEIILFDRKNFESQKGLFAPCDDG